MPRRADPGNEVQRKRQERYRRNLNDNRKPEVGMIDTALVNSLAIYAHLSADREKDQRRLEALKTMAVKFLMSKGYSDKQFLKGCYRP